jgi:hypothetical protein
MARGVQRGIWLTQLCRKRTSMRPLGQSGGACDPQSPRPSNPALAGFIFTFATIRGTGALSLIFIKIEDRNRSVACG